MYEHIYVLEYMYKNVCKERKVPKIECTLTHSVISKLKPCSIRENLFRNDDDFIGFDNKLQTNCQWKSKPYFYFFVYLFKS